MEPDLRGRRLVHVVTVPQSLSFFRGQLTFMCNLGLEIEVITGPGEGIDEFAREEGVQVHVVPMARRIDPMEDVHAVRGIRAVLRRLRPHVVHAHTPKGGLLGVLAARSMGVPKVVYQLRGLRMATLTGAKRALFAATERTAMNAAHLVIANSHSLRQEAIDLRLTWPGHITVLGAGSGNGVDAEGRFNPANVPATRRAELRASLGVREDDVLVLFMARMVRDKGIAELSDAWRSLAATHPRAHLALVGGDDPTDPPAPGVMEVFTPAMRAHRIGATKDVMSWYAASDLVVLPTYREGMPNVLLEGQAMGRPVVATRVAGCVDCVVDGVTGSLVSPRDPVALASALRASLPADVRSARGKAAREHMLRTFAPHELWRQQAAIYAR